MDKRFLFLSFASAALIVPSISNAHLVEAPMEVMATVVSSCELSVTPIDFGNYAGAEINTTGEVIVVCNDGVPYKIAMNAGMNTDNANRRMADSSGNNTLPYRLTYQGVDWGDLGVHDTFLSNPVQGVGTGAASSFVVEAMLFEAQDVPPGVYSDTVIVSVDF